MNNYLWVTFPLGLIMLAYGFFMFWKLIKGYGYSWTTKKFVEPKTASGMENITMFLSSIGVFLASLGLILYSINRL